MKTVIAVYMQVSSLTSQTHCSSVTVLACGPILKFTAWQKGSWVVRAVAISLVENCCYILLQSYLVYVVVAWYGTVFSLGE